MKLICSNYFIPKRYWIIFLAFLGEALMYILRTNLSIAIVDMTTDRNITIGNRTYIEKSEFNWSSVEKGILLSLFSYGFLLTPAGSLLSIKYGGATICGLGIGLTGLLTIVTPFLLRFNFVVYSIARVMEGVFEGFITSGCVQLFIHWIPPEERSRSMVFVQVGGFFGAIVNYPLCGYIANSFGWPGIFYVSGGISLIWYFVWFMLVRNDPQDDKLISESEKTYLKEKINYLSHKKIKYRWKSIFTSKPIWAYFNDSFVMAWSYSFIVYCLPLYVNDVFDSNIKDVALISSIPVSVSIFSEMAAASLTDYFRKKKTIKISNVHKYFILFGQFSAVILLIIIAMWTNFIGSIICFTLIRVCFSFAEASYEALPIDMAMNYGSLIYAIATTAFSFGCLLNPTIMGYLVTNNTRAEWNKYFIFLCLFNVWGMIIYWIFGSGELQPWAKLQDETKTDSTA